MSPGTKRRQWADLLALLAVLGAAAGTLVFRELYHRGSSETNGLTQLAIAAAISGALLLRRSAAASHGPWALMLALALSLEVQDLWPLFLPGPAWLAKGLVIAALLVAAFLLTRLSTANWRSVRIAVAIAAAFWFASPYAFQWVMAPSLRWPPGHSQSDVDHDRARQLTVFLLLDELNAREATPIIDELKSAGLHVAYRGVPSVGANTRNVVASMFSGVIFSKALPCGPTSLCTERNAFNFAHIEASRSDIDVVGFAHPYCAMSGLRSCLRVETPLIWLDSARLRCSLWRRIGLPLGVDMASCKRTYLAGFAETTQQLIDGALRARALREGGVLFAHMQLPHPPGLSPEGSLREHYVENIERARLLVNAITTQAVANGLTIQAVVFSDHPLRQTLWCGSFAPYLWNGCKPDPDLQDSQVPVIVAGSHAVPDISALANNQTVFSLGRVRP